MKASSVRVVPANRFERRRERTRQELVAAAVRVLAEKGLHDTKITDIAAAADIGVGTFYLHFPTKDALFDAVVEETVTRFKATVDAARKRETDPIAQMRASTAAFCRFAHENREVFQIVFGHAAAYNDVIHRAQALFAADIEQTVRAGIAQGSIAKVPVQVATQALIGMATQILSWWTEHEDISLEEIQETIVNMALHGLTPTAPRKGARHV
jgi:AcrR family transcriptional regulator